MIKNDDCIKRNSTLLQKYLIVRQQVFAYSSKIGYKHVYFIVNYIWLHTLYDFSLDASLSNDKKAVKWYIMLSRICSFLSSRQYNWLKHWQKLDYPDNETELTNWQDFA